MGRVQSSILSKENRKILTAIVALTRRLKRPPTMREIAEEAGKSSTNTVSWHVCRLKRLGYIDYEPHQTRTILVTSLPEGMGQ